MKLYKMRKFLDKGRKRNIKKAALAMSMVMLSGLLAESSNPLPVKATNTQQQIENTIQEKNELEDKLEEQNDNLDDLKGKQKTLQGELKTLNQQMNEVSANLENLEGQMREKETEIEEITIALEDAVARENQQYDDMVARIHSMYESNGNNLVLNLIFSGQFSELINAGDWMEEVANYDQMKLDEFQKTREMVEETKARLEEEKEQLDLLIVSAEAEKSKVSGLISQTSKSIGKYADQIEDAEQKALEYEAELKKKEEDIIYLKKKLAEELAKSREAANARWRDISEISFAEGDRKLLANIIYCEAGAEPYEGQVAVGAVVINRVKSSTFPDTVVGVVYQSGQFSPVGSGRLDLALASDKASASCYRAADEVMRGMSNVGNCVFFRTPVPGLEGIRIGNHIFY